jgi:hypothetical protein
LNAAAQRHCSTSREVPQRTLVKAAFALNTPGPSTAGVLFMLEIVEKLAEFTVARACGFAMLAILVTIVALVEDPAIALKTGAVLSLLTSMILVLKAALAETKPHRTTELWLLLKPDERPHEAVAQRIIALALREAFLRFALYFASGAAAMLIALLLITLLGRPRV